MKWIKDLNVPETVKFLKGKKGKNFLDIGLHNDFYGYDTQSVLHSKNQLGIYQTKKLLYNKRNSQQNEKAIYQMEKIVANCIT